MRRHLPWYNIHKLGGIVAVVYNTLNHTQPLLLHGRSKAAHYTEVHHQFHLAFRNQVLGSGRRCHLSHSCVEDVEIAVLLVMDIQIEARRAWQLLHFSVMGKN